MYSVEPSPIAASFAKLLVRTDLTDVDHRAYQTHRLGIEASLENNFVISKFERIGSYVRGSAIRSYSDLDLLAVVRKGSIVWGSELISPNTLLRNVRSALCRTFSRTKIGRDGQAVVVAFADGRSIDVVPGIWVRALDNGWPLYQIPDGLGDWLSTAPSLHSKYIGDGDYSAGGKLKSVIRILKHWKTSRRPALPFSAFHLELLLAESGTCHGAKSLASCVADTLTLLQERACGPILDPCGVSGHIRVAGTEVKQARLLASVCRSAAWARKAVFFEQMCAYGQARTCWSQVFNGAFPR